MTSSPPPTGFYLHWPFCARVCPYCDFTVTRSRGEDADAWGAALTDDLRYLRDRFGSRRLVSLYLGGGTPSLMPDAVLGALIRAADDLFGLADGAEVTLEANPGDVAPERLAAWRAAGVNRLSLGVQSFDDGQLAFLGRDHDGRTARRAVDLTLAAFERSTFDLIYALPDVRGPDAKGPDARGPGEGVDAWSARLTEALGTGVRHLSLYQLTVEPGTAFWRAVERRRWSPPAEGLAADLYEATDAVTRAAGLPAYEVSSHAAPGHEAVHNALYWRGADWLAAGPGAHGRVTTAAGRVATAGTARIGDYRALTPAERIAEEALTPEEALTERVAGGLRRSCGLDLAALPEPARARLATNAVPLAADGLLTLGGDRLAATGEGRLVLDALTAALLA